MEIEVVWYPKALEALDHQFRYIARKAPDTAADFIDAMLDFGESLGERSERHPICRFPALASLQFRCAVFRKNFVFIYKPVSKQVRIYHIVRTSQLTASFEL